jgi:cysteine-rich repeat protein
VQLGETCDDGNTASGDLPARSGNGVEEGTEECDDGNSMSGDGCSSICKDEPICGDGAVEAPEVCDDGNTANGDGCSANCQTEIR